mmetsp:Transcript_27786/g.83582  ORF Transcript_27786/g.83582 Transcript_27786/m.83582 type:complete len:145 (-) Transcript_27786:133-567(-)
MSTTSKSETAPLFEGGSTSHRASATGALKYLAVAAVSLAIGVLLGANLKVVPYKHTEPMELPSNHTEPMELPSDSCPSDSRVGWEVEIAKVKGEGVFFKSSFKEVTYGIFNKCDGTDPTDTYLYTCGDKVVVCFCDDVCYSNSD